MKKISFWMLYFAGIGCFFLLAVHKLGPQGASVYMECPADAYGFTIQVHNQWGESLKGVSFQLYGTKDSTMPLSYFKQYYTDNKKTPQTYVETTTQRAGQLHFYGLAEGTYYLEETDVPKGYQVLKERIAIYVDQDSTKQGIDYYIINGTVKK